MVECNGDNVKIRVCNSRESGQERRQGEPLPSDRQLMGMMAVRVGGVL